VNEPIAVVGIGCRFPNGEGVDAFWSVLRDGVDCVGEVPPDRWNNEAYYDPAPATAGKTYCRWGGFLPQGDAFDAGFFDISPDDAMKMDPQQGVVLETAWQALEVAGIVPRSLAGSRTGVFVGISNSDFDRMWSRDGTRLDVMYVTGASYSVAANRLSYFLDVRGPSLAVDTACASSLTAIHLACQSLRTKECDIALAGGVHLVLCADKLIAFADGRSLAKDGRCKSFDARADGNVWGEGCAMLVLKRLSTALESRDAIFGLVLGSAVGHNGQSNGIGAPSGAAQKNIIAQALTSAGVEPCEIGYVEAHASGTLVGDAVEVKALMSALSEKRTDEQRCAIGCVKTNLGHLEAAAGVAGVVKTLLAMREQYIPPTLHLQQLSPHLQIAGTPFEICSNGLSWRRGDRPRRAGVSAFSFGGSGAHLILEESPNQEDVCDSAGVCLVGPPVLVISARTEAALRRLAGRYAEHIAAITVESEPHKAVLETCYTASVCRTHFLHRLALVIDRPVRAAEQLRYVERGEPTEDVLLGRAPRRPAPLVFIFGPRVAGASSLVSSLTAGSSGFRASYEHWEAALGREIERQGGGAYERELQTMALQIAFAGQLTAVGLRPALMLGDAPTGVIAAALVAEALDVVEAVRMLKETVSEHDFCASLIDLRTRFAAVRKGLCPIAVRQGGSLTRLWPANQGDGDIAPPNGAMHIVFGECDDSCDGPTTLRVLTNSGSDAHSLAGVLAATYVRGHSLDWPALVGGASLRRRQVPLYPFERRRHYPVLDPHSSGFERLIARRHDGRVEVTMTSER
jgi:acyl transferase domain-containing protein